MSPNTSPVEYITYGIDRMPTPKMLVDTEHATDSWFIKDSLTRD